MIFQIVLSELDWEKIEIIKLLFVIGAPDQYVVNPRTPSILPATRRNFRSYGGGNNNNNRAFNSRSGEYASREGRDNEEIFSSNDALGTSFQHQIYNMNQHLQVITNIYALKK